MSDIEQDFNAEISALRAERPTLTAVELDAVRARVQPATAPRRRSAWGSFARTRGAVVAAITAGALMSTGGTAIAVSDLASSGNASIAQYAGTPAANPNNGVAGDNGAGGKGPSNGVAGDNGAGGKGGNPRGAVSPSEQAAQPTTSSSGKLPFTGFAAIPILLIGLTLLIAGLAARRLPGAHDGGGSSS